jgi:hypothetical protein
MNIEVNTWMVREKENNNSHYDSLEGGKNNEKKELAQMPERNLEYP